MNQSPYTSFLSPMLLEPLSPTLNIMSPNKFPSPSPLTGLSAFPMEESSGFNDLFSRVLDGYTDQPMTIRQESSVEFQLGSSNPTEDCNVIQSVSRVKKEVKIVIPERVKQRMAPKKKKKKAPKKGKARRGRPRKKISRGLKIPSDEYLPDCEKWTRARTQPCMRSVVEDLDIYTKTRCEEKIDYVPTCLYSSLKYEVYVDMNLLELPLELPFILAKVKVVHAEKMTEIIKGGEKVIKGTTECALTKNFCDEDGLFKFDGKMRIQFDNALLSYHHKKYLIRLEVQFFKPKDLQNPLIVQRSSPFKVMARKPSSKVGKKRKRSGMDQFHDKLDDLVRCAKRLKVEERDTMFDLVQEKLREIDEDFSLDLD